MDSLVIYEPTFRPVQINLYNENSRTPKQHLRRDDLRMGFPQLYRDESMELKNWECDAPPVKVA